jgi:hypothetical protein
LSLCSKSHRTADRQQWMETGLVDWLSRPKPDQPLDVNARC